MKLLRSIYFQLGLLLAVMLIIIEGVLLVYSIESKRSELNNTNKKLEKIIATEYGMKNFVFYSEADIESKISKYKNNTSS